MSIPAPYLVFLADARDTLAAKTGQGLVDWRPDRVLGQLCFANCKADLGVPNLSLEAGVAAGAKTLVIGTVSPGGDLPGAWQAVFEAALAAGLDIASGMHQRLNDNVALVALARQHGASLHDVRHPPGGIRVGSGQPRGGRRLLTVGTDCSIGKKYTALAIERELGRRGVKADFRATGQTGILIAGEGIAVDAVVADFIAGAAEQLSPANSDDHWDVIEGQGSLAHPSFAGVSAGLLQGAQPHAVVLCHEPTRTTMRNVDALMPDPAHVLALTLELGRFTNPDITCVGISVNTSALAGGEAAAVLARLSQQFGVPAVDPMRDGVAAVVDALLARFP